MERLTKMAAAAALAVFLAVGSGNAAPKKLVVHKKAAVVVHRKAVVHKKAVVVTKKKVATPVSKTSTPVK